MARWARFGDWIFWLCGTLLISDTRRLGFVLYYAAPRTALLLANTFSSGWIWGNMKLCRHHTRTHTHTNMRCNITFIQCIWQMDLVKTGVCLTHLSLLLKDINRPEVSPRWLCCDRWAVQRGSSMTSCGGVVHPGWRATVEEGFLTTRSPTRSDFL